MENKEFIIYSTEHQAWWKKNKFGYTSHIEMAGVFSYEEAIKICTDSNRLNILNDHKLVVEEMMVPIPEELASYLKNQR